MTRRPERRVGLHPAPPTGHPPRVLVSPRSQSLLVRFVTVIGGSMALGMVAGQSRVVRRMLGAAVLGGLGALALGIWQALWPKQEKLDIQLPNLPHGWHGTMIAQLSDLHLDQPFAIRNARWAVQQTMQARPDLIVLTGDFVSHVIPHELSGLLQHLHAPLGVYAIWGNHDYWSDIAQLRNVIEGAGITLLQNEHRVLTRNGDVLYLAGTDDLWEGQADLARALAGIPPGTPVILLAHEPDVADDAATHGVALQLSGHTHGGQVALPFLGPLFLPRHGWRYVRGLHHIGTLVLYISRGLGGIPFRLGSRAEITLITLSVEAQSAKRKAENDRSGE